MSNIAAKLRERHWRAGTETNDEARVRRQREREEGAAEIERLTARVEELEKVLSDGVFVLDDLTASRVDDEVLTSVIDEFRAAITQETRDE